METANTIRSDGEYRRWDGVHLSGSVLVSKRPLSVTRLNPAAVDTVATLDEDEFQSPQSIARATDHDVERVVHLLERLHRRGFLEWRPARDPAHRPPVSIVVTVRNDREHLRACLDALTDLEYPTYEVVIVDDGSDDGTTDVATNHPITDDRCVRMISVGSVGTPLGIGASRNRGVEAATHDVVAFTDADCRPRPDWLSDLVPCLAEHDVVGGRVRPAGDTAASAYEAVNSSLDMGTYASRINPGGNTPYLATANLIGRRSVFELVRFPKRDVAEDVEMCWQAIDAGFDIVYTPRGVVNHDYRSGLRTFAARRSAYGASEALLARDHGRAAMASVDVPFAATLVATLAVLAMTLTGRASSVAFVIAATVAIVSLGVHGVGLSRRYRALPPSVSAGDLSRSWLRERLSSTYALSREVTRYYAVPLVFLGVLISAVGATGLGTTAVSLVVAATVVPLLVEYRVHDPDISIPGYAGYYIADHLGYQHGIYWGAFAHRTLEHVNPASRFRLVVPGMVSAR